MPFNRQETSLQKSTARLSVAEHKSDMSVKMADANKTAISVSALEVRPTNEISIGIGKLNSVPTKMPAHQSYLPSIKSPLKTQGMRRDVSVPMKKVKMNIAPMPSRTPQKTRPRPSISVAPMRFMTKSVEELNFEEPDEEFEQIKGQVNEVMNQIGLNYGWERTGKPMDKSRFSDAGSANNSLENPYNLYGLNGTLKSYAMDASHEKSFDSRASAA